MTTHNVGRINWSLLTENIKLIQNDRLSYFECRDRGKIEHVAIQLLNVIDEFSKTEQKKPTKNVLLLELNKKGITDRELNPVSWVPEPTEYYLIRGISQAVSGPVQYLIECYVYLNLILAGFEPTFMLILGYVVDFSPCDNNLPEFLCDEFEKIFMPVIDVIKYKNPQRSFTSLLSSDLQDYADRYSRAKPCLSDENIQGIRNFCSLIFRSMYLLHKDYKFINYDLICDTITSMFYFSTYEDESISRKFLIH